MDKKFSKEIPSFMLRKFSNKNFLFNGMKKKQFLKKISNLKVKIGKNCNKRKFCILCKKKLEKKDKFFHQSLRFFSCNNCTHVQSEFIYSKEIVQSLKKIIDYDKIYSLDPNQNLSKLKDIYKPKLDWFLQVLKQRKIKFDNLSICEIGSGNGLLLSLLEKKFKKLQGYEFNENLFLDAKKKLKDQSRINLSKLPIDELISNTSYDIYVAIFVFEHFFRIYDLIKAINEKKPGTIFFFSVPMLGFSSILETIFKDDFARNFDGLIHQQMFTNKSLQYFLKKSNLNIFAQWSFGQDANDMYRIMMDNIEDNYTDELYKFFDTNLKTIVNSFQKILDKNSLADSIHILAQKKK